MLLFWVHQGGFIGFFQMEECICDWEVALGTKWKQKFTIWTFMAYTMLTDDTSPHCMIWASLHVEIRRYDQFITYRNSVYNFVNLLIKSFFVFFLVCHGGSVDTHQSSKFIVWYGKPHNHDSVIDTPGPVAKVEREEWSSQQVQHLLSFQLFSLASK